MNPKPISTNHLIHETSPYLLQHAHNPVNWYPWTPIESGEAWNKAKTEDKLVLVSIGYSSCHWCHVMEHETFEDDAAARMMNEFFVCIKVDREERPDIDQVYMTAVQLMTGSGGWPLNCFCLPDGRPVYGGTYFPKPSWMDLLMKLHDFYADNKQQAEKYAEELTQGVRQSEMIVKNDSEPAYSRNDLDEMVVVWKKYFDPVEGGPNRSPKFPMPNNYEFLLHYSWATKNDEIKNYVLLTLDKMAFGGIYDQVGGGFARYSTDVLWKVPHFEKMLYDNAQLISLYSHAYQVTENPLYKNIVFETLDFISREMTSEEGGFYSALDADSEGEEGKFYVWTKEELENMLADKFNVFAAYYNVNEIGFWEHGNHILLRKKTDETIAKDFAISINELQKTISESRKILLEQRNKRIKPGLDDKQLTSWNALMIKGYCDAYQAFGEKKFLDAAIKCMNLILSKVKREDGGLNHSYKTGRATINGYLEDYSFSIEALISLYQCTFDEKWLLEAKQLADYAIAHFHDASTGMFWFTSNLDPALITRKKEIHDNVIPASNSSMGKALFLLSKYFADQPYFSISDTMLNNVKGDFKKYPSSFSNWANLMLYRTEPFYEVVVVGENTETKRKELSSLPLFNHVLAGSNGMQSTLGLLKERYVEGKTLIYVCVNNACKLPVENSGPVLELMGIN